MGDKPILFSGPMVRALLNDRKTQTRRANHLQRLRRFGPVTEFGRSDTKGYDWHFRDKAMRWHDLRHAELLKYLPWQIGDRLYVREHWRTYVGLDAIAPRGLVCGGGLDIEYLADGTNRNFGKHRLAMHMPRWASRLTLTVTNVRVERLQDISDRGAQNDCTAEGVFHCGMTVPSYGEWHGSGFRSSEKHMYRQLWESINGPGSWEENPWVAAYTFTVQRGNIDAIVEGR